MDSANLWPHLMIDIVQPKYTANKNHKKECLKATKL